MQFKWANIMVCEIYFRKSGLKKKGIPVEDFVDTIRIPKTYQPLGGLQIKLRKN